MPRVSLHAESGELVFERTLGAHGVAMSYGLLVEDGSFLVGYGKVLYRFSFRSE